MILNAKSSPQVYYGLHMVEGTAEYSEPGKDPYRIYIGESAIKNMNPTFQGKPVYVDHVDEVNESDLEQEQELDGVVVRSFFNKADGKNWTEFVVFTDRGRQAIQNGWRLSNAYVPKGFAGGGENHGVSYSKEVTSGEYEHLAIVQNPRYEESVIYTPEQFKDYNEGKEAELLRLANSKRKKENSTMAFKLNIFKRTKVENTKEFDLTGLMVELPKSKIEMSLTEVVEKYDAIQNMHGYANGEHLVKVGEDEMSVNDLVKKHTEMCNAQAESEETEHNEGEGEPSVDVENDAEEEEGVEVGLHDVGDRGGDHSLNNEEEDDVEAPAPKDKKKNSKNKAAVLARAKAAALKNARDRGHEETAVVDLPQDQVARGKARYGS